MLTRLTTLLALLTLAGGCASTKTGTFQVTVTNRTAGPISVGFVKHGPPLEKNWDSPEAIAIAAPRLGDKHWGTLILPNESRSLGPQSGVFEKGSFPLLRIYRGDLTINELLAINRQSPDRISVPLLIGKGFVTVLDHQNKITADYVRP